MTRLTRSTLLIAAVAALGVYLLLASLMSTDLLVEVMNGLFLGMAVVVTVVFFPLIKRALAQREFDRVAQLTVGIVLSWVSMLLSRSVNTYGKIFDVPGKAAGSWLVAVAAYLAILSGILHITAPGMVDDRLKYNKGFLALAAALGAVAAAVAIWLQRGA
jgi:hypothetical protein